MLLSRATLSCRQFQTQVTHSTQPISSPPLSTTPVVPGNVPKPIVLKTVSNSCAPSDKVYARSTIRFPDLVPGSIPSHPWLHAEARRLRGELCPRLQEAAHYPSRSWMTNSKATLSKHHLPGLHFAHMFLSAMAWSLGRGPPIQALLDGLAYPPGPCLS